MSCIKKETDFYRKIDREILKKNKPISNIEEPVHKADGIEATYIPHGVYTNIFKPAVKSERVKDRQWLVEHSYPMNLQSVEYYLQLGG